MIPPENPGNGGSPSIAFAPPRTSGDIVALHGGNVKKQVDGWDGAICDERHAHISRSDDKSPVACGFFNGSIPDAGIIYHDAATQLFI